MILRGACQQRNIGLLAIVVAAGCFGTFPYFARSVYGAGITPEQAFFWRYCLAAVVLLPWALRLLRRRLVLLQVIGAGMFLGVGVYVYLLSLSAMPVALAGVIFFAFPAFAFVYRTWLLRTPPTALAVVATVLVIIGAAIACGSVDTGAVGLGDLAFAFITPMCYGAMITIIAHIPRDVAAVPAAGGLYLGTAIIALPVMLFYGATVDLTDVISVWAALGGLIVISGVVPGVLTTFGAPRAGAALTAVAAAFELVVVLISGWIFVGEPVVFAQALGAVIIILAIVVASIDRV